MTDSKPTKPSGPHEPVNIPHEERGYVPGEPQRARAPKNRKRIMPGSSVALGTDDDPLTW